MSGREVRKIKHTGEVSCVALTPDGSRAVSGQGKQVLVWDCNTGGHVKGLTKHTGAVRRVAVSARGDKAVSGSQDMTVMVWDLGGLCHERTFEGHQGVVRGVSIGEGRVVSCGQDKEVRVWELGSGRCEHVLRGHTDDVRGVSASSDGRLAGQLPPSGAAQQPTSAPRGGTAHACAHIQIRRA